jgi:hypothetical protein
MKDATQLRKDAEHYRWLAAGFADRRTVEAITELAAEYETTAQMLEDNQKTAGDDTPEKSAQIRVRAYQMWKEQGCPQGLHADHWHAAEHELAEDDRN